ncbi:hypothetical protein OG982_20720 [Streptomyces sp. NBC_01551]|uniref:hypothetical protein n=1 Tax=Streptomyces sp. NBC_01551 TaxID=2975876 RepID=UPI002251F766|nr:hypothetical protein [Streptomyces sp. NBC_01551]MCX4528079.1 hypothetical protein [Streptomyces sp. NBC_01551]
MEEWKYTLLNGVISTGGAVLVGIFALYGMLRQAARAHEAASQQAVALLEQVAKSAEAARDQARWQLRRDSYAAMLAACDGYEDAIDEVGWFLADQYDDAGRVITNFESTKAEVATDAIGRIRAHVHTLRLEGPKELEPQIKEFLKMAGETYEMMRTWTSLLHDGQDSDFPDEWQYQQGALSEAREALFQAMYEVLHK